MIGHEVAYRAAEDKDYAEIAELFRRQWCADQEPRAGRAAAEANICRYLCDTDWALVAESKEGPMGGRVLGAVFLDIDGRGNAETGLRWGSHREEILEEAISAGVDKRQLMREVSVVEHETAIGGEFATEAGAGAVAEIKLLLVSSDAQGLGVGGRLFAHALGEAHAHARRAFLLTDDTCDLGFYEHAGLQRAVRRTFRPEGAPEDGSIGVYVYAEAGR